MRVKSIGLCLLALASVATMARAVAAPVPEPTVFQSRNGALNLIMVAQPTTLTGLSVAGFHPQGWAYQVCYRAPGQDVCPSTTPTPYGGVRLALQPGDTLNIHFVNNLPPVDPASLDHDPDDGLLAINPTNLHTHGLIVNALPNSAIPPATPVYGDFVFTAIFNPANGDPATVNPGAYDTLHAHGDVVKSGVVDYSIKIPGNHPRGQFWFHPHMHGIALPQVAAGLAGIITIGDVGDYVCLDLACMDPVPKSLVRHLILKEMQVLPGPKGGTPHLETDAFFCLPDLGAGEPPRQGSCPSNPGTYPAGGRWFYTVNGAQYPTIAQATADGEVWRIQNAAGSVTYDLTLTDDSSGRKMPVQILAMDGISVNVPAGTSMGDMVQLGGGRFRVAACPTSSSNYPAAPAPLATLGAWAPAGSAAANNPIPVCATEIFMMPSSRVEIWASYTDSNNQLASAPPGATATLRTLHYNTGPVGDDWPAVDLATVQFASGFRSTRADHLTVHGDALRAMLPGGIFKSANPDVATSAGSAPPSCAPLAAGHRRRIFFANMGSDANDVPIFGLGYEETDANGVPVPGTSHNIEPFDPAHQICVPLGAGNTPQTETWELINLSGEMHNFHIHQTKFTVVSASSPPGSVLSPSSADGAGIATDNIPVPYATFSSGQMVPPSGACSIGDFRTGRCKVNPVVVQIPFTKVGRFVFHCHILEHEDGGMMHSIVVVKGP